MQLGIARRQSCSPRAARGSLRKMQELRKSRCAPDFRNFRNSCTGAAYESQMSLPEPAESSA
jgi:hypothetical protein